MPMVLITFTGFFFSPLRMRPCPKLLGKTRPFLSNWEKNMLLQEKLMCFSPKKITMYYSGRFVCFSRNKTKYKKNEKKMGKMFSFR